MTSIGDTLMSTCDFQTCVQLSTVCREAHQFFVKWFPFICKHQSKPFFLENIQSYSDYKDFMLNIHTRLFEDTSIIRSSYTHPIRLHILLNQFFNSDEDMIKGFVAIMKSKIDQDITDFLIYLLEHYIYNFKDANIPHKIFKGLKALFDINKQTINVPTTISAYVNAKALHYKKEVFIGGYGGVYIIDDVGEKKYIRA